ncbi:hypothetical protein WJR50_16580 [Catalinimonas sp. 4WD22]|uniref:hypothetical protein n=1 Tax=Catalinimonas locisalis TaxID=3133978 RepID=UPI0031011863
MQRSGNFLPTPPVCVSQTGTQQYLKRTVGHRPWRKKFMVLLVTLLLWLISSEALLAQRVWSQVSLDRSSTYVGQPVEVRITVYTSTWFTAGIDPGNIKVNGAFTVYFRPVSRSFQQDGQNYAGVELIYHVFPFEDEGVIFPSLEIAVETPPEGDFKGVRRTLKTAEKQIKVKPVPPNFSESQWLVATGLSVTDQWRGNRQEVKVGDVLERRISRTAYGTVAELIPPIAWDSLSGVSEYPTRSTVENQRTKTAISATRTETMRYLFEKEGEVILPEMVFTWYNPYRQKLYKRTLEEVRLEVQPNPDLGVLASIRDSLEQEMVLQEEAEAEEEPLTILGMSPRKFLLLAVLSLLALYLLFLITRKLFHWAKVRRGQYLKSEAYYFHQFKRAVRQKKSRLIIQSLYRWIDELELDEPSAQAFAEKYGSPALQQEVILLESQYKEGKAWSVLDIKEWKKARKKYKNREVETTQDWQLAWINPTA